MKTYALRPGPSQAEDERIRHFKVYQRTSLMFIYASAKRHAVEMSHREKDGFEICLQGDPAAMKAVEHDFNTRPR
jgi:hypothetical protein